MLAFSWCAAFRLAAANRSLLLQSIWMQLFNNATVNNWHSSALKEWLHTAGINHLAEQKYRVIVIEQYHMINTFPLEILVPQRLEMIYGQASPWHFSLSSRLLYCDIFLWRQIIQKFVRKNLNELTHSRKERNDYHLNEEVQGRNKYFNNRTGLTPSFSHNVYHYLLRACFNTFLPSPLFLSWSPQTLLLVLFFVEMMNLIPMRTVISRILVDSFFGGKATYSLTSSLDCLLQQRQ